MKLTQTALLIIVAVHFEFTLESSNRDFLQTRTCNVLVTNAICATMSKRLTAMADNPRGNWTIADVAALCNEFGIRCTAPTGGGSHFKVGHPSMREKLTIPFKRPIKPVYIRKLVAFVEAVRNLP